jgi:outer membrane protein assembly factor BamD (BamD/ComL family)
MKRLEETNEILRKENAQLRKYLNYDIDYLLRSHKDLSIAIEEIEEMLSDALQELTQEREACKRIYEEYTTLTREKEKHIMNAEMDKNYLETKNSLLKEVL